MSPDEIIGDLSNAVRILKDGGVILYPTDTVWGLGCDATNEAALCKLFDIKKRPDSKAMISLVNSIEEVKRWVENVPKCAFDLYENASSPLTIIMNGAKGISSKLLADDGSAAFRIPNGNDYTMKLCRMLNRPLISTSANLSGLPTAKIYNDIDKEIKHAVDYVCKYGRDQKAGIPSSIIKINKDGSVTKIR